MTGFVEVRTFEHAHSDNRRKILECNFLTSSVQYFTIMERLPLGNHFHKERHETFVIASGGGKCCYVTVNENGVPNGEQVTLPVRQGSVIQIHPLTAHAFLLEPGSTMLCFSSIPFDSENQDMFAFQLQM